MMSPFAQRAEDAVVADLAVREARVLLTEDKDFGQLVYARSQRSEGVILFRFPAQARSGAALAVLELVSSYRDRIVGSFVVLSPGRLRLRRIP